MKKKKSTLVTPFFNASPDEDDRDAMQVRLAGGMAAVRRVMSDGSWYTLQDISNAITEQYVPTPSVSAHIRSLRKRVFGCHVIYREHVSRGLYRYKLDLEASGVPRVVKHECPCCGHVFAGHRVDE